jgi:serine/threonine protein phosphatase PrpC
MKMSASTTIPTATAMLNLQAGLQVTQASASDAGRKESNDDALCVHLPAEPLLLSTKGIVAALADGVSTAEAGAEASSICVKSFIDEYYLTPDTWPAAQSAETTLNGINRQLYERGGDMRDAERGFVSTFSVLILKSRTAHIFHIGDTRVYKIDDEGIRQLTRDHKTRISAGEVYLARAMGLDTSAQIDYRCEDLELGDVFLLSSDGLHDHVTANDLVTLVANSADDAATCETLVKRAIANGSEDNVSCVIVRVTQVPEHSIDAINRQLTRLPFPPELNVGDELDGYRVASELHTSNRSQVYLVEDLASGERLVMKTPSRNFEDDPAYIERFVMEEWVGRRVRSPHVVAIVPPARPPNRLYYLSEHIEGCTLRQWMDRHPLPAVDTVMPLVGEMVKGLRAFERRSVLHQDLKPGNVMINVNERVIIVDFGSCYVRGFEDLSTPIERDLILGTVDYAAPEYHLGLKAGIQADLFSLACMVYEMLTGALPYGRQYSRARSERDFEALSYTPAYRHNPDVPVWVDGALKRAVAIKPADRYPALSEFYHDLQHPNKKYLAAYRQPLIERDPVLFWKSLSLVLFALVLLLLVLLAQAVK